MKISILSYSFRDSFQQGKIDLFGYLESVRYRYGLDAADIWNQMLASTDEAYLNTVREALDERELTLADLCVDRAHLWEPEAEAREQNYRNALAHLRAAEILGAKIVRIDAGGRDEQWTDEAFDYIVKRYREYAQRAYDNGYVMATENHWGTEGAWPNLKRLYEAVDHPAFGVSCHIGNWHGPDAEKGDELVAPWVVHTHFDWEVTHTCLDEKVRLLKEAGYQGYYSVEHRSGEHEYTRVGIQVAKVREVLGRWREERSGG